MIRIFSEDSKTFASSLLVQYKLPLPCRKRVFFMEFPCMRENLTNRPIRQIPQARVLPSRPNFKALHTCSLFSSGLFLISSQQIKPIAPCARPCMPPWSTRITHCVTRVFGWRLLHWQIRDAPSALSTCLVDRRHRGVGGCPLSVSCRPDPDPEPEVSGRRRVGRSSWACTGKSPAGFCVLYISILYPGLNFRLAPTTMQGFM